MTLLLKYLKIINMGDSEKGKEKELELKQKNNQVGKNLLEETQEEKTQRL